jgi:adenosylmethionine-8-amino-7-oxononanoate aminotransferase
VITYYWRPPFIINEEEIHSITTLLTESIDEALRCTKG